MTGPITLYALRMARENRRLKRRARQLLADLANADALADTWEQKWLEERAARVDLERLHGWLGSEAT